MPGMNAVNAGLLYLSRESPVPERFTCNATANGYVAQCEQRIVLLCILSDAFDSLVT